MAAPHSRSVAQAWCQNKANFYHRAPEKSMGYRNGRLSLPY